MLLKEKLKLHDPVRIVGAYDAISSALVERAGFDAIWASGLCISATQGVPDANIMSMNELLFSLKSMRRSTKLPIVADCDTGYGDFHNTIHLVKELCECNISGMCIEDKVFPKINSFSKSRTQLLEKPEKFAVKIKAAIDHKTKDDFLVIARTEALIAGMDVKEALYRAHMYRYAGADAIVIHSKSNTPEDVLKFCREWKDRLPVIVIPTTYPTFTIEDAKRNGVSAIIYANQILRTSIYAIERYLKELLSSQSLSECNMDISSVKDIFSLQNMDQYKEDEEYYNQFEKFILKENILKQSS